MELNINSPAYFNQHYGIDDEVCRFCQKAYMYFKDKEYSDTLHTIGIMPSAAPKELYEAGNWKEGIRFLNKNSCAAISIRINFDEYFTASSEQKIEIMKATVLTAVQRVKSKGKFDFESFKADFDKI